MDFWSWNSKPKGASFFEERDEGAIDMGSHDSVHGADELAANEDDGDCGGGAEEAHESFLHIFSLGVLVQLVHRGVNAHPAEEALHGVAHAATADAEDDHGVLRGQPLYVLQWVPAESAPRRRHVRTAPWLRLVLHCDCVLM